MTSEDIGLRQLEVQKLAMEKSRFKADVLKWLIAAVGAVVSFLVIDYGRLQLEKFKATSENERALLAAYLSATETIQPDLWLRKLQIIETLSSTPAMKDWAAREARFVVSCSAKEALYKETLRTTVILLRTDQPDNPERKSALKRFEQLYWADLPYVKEDSEVSLAMIKFREQLIRVQNATGDADAEWGKLNVQMLDLAEALRKSDPRKSGQCDGEPGLPPHAN